MSNKPVILNASPFIVLCNAELLQILSALFAPVAMPQAVRQEILNGLWISDAVMQTLARQADNNPKTAVWEFLKTTDQFVIDTQIEQKLLITVAPAGYLKRKRV